jgi:hypothetical protein
VKNNRKEKREIGSYIPTLYPERYLKICKDCHLAG